MPSAAVARRRRSAQNARVAAKQRRQLIVAGVLCVVLVALLAYVVPHTLKRLDVGSSPPGAAPSAPAGHAPRHEPKALRGGTGADPFAARSLPDGDTAVAAARGPRPFMGPQAPPVEATPPPPPPAAQALPHQLVIGRPGGGRVATHGWIVILASIPEGSGRDAAVRFARAARANVGGLSVLNSSRRRPLRGGYWVVYTGPYDSLAGLSRPAGARHAP